MPRLPYDVRGRGLVTARVEITYHRDGATFRIDDLHNPEFWLEINVTREELAQLLARINAVSPVLDLGNLPLLPMPDDGIPPVPPATP